MTDQPLWTPSAERIATANMTAFMAWVNQPYGRDFADYAALYEWSVSESERFWTAVWEFCGVIGERGQSVLVDGNQMPGAKWFPDARLNYAENLLRDRDNADGVVFLTQFLWRF